MKERRTSLRSSHGPGSGQARVLLPLVGSCCSTVSVTVLVQSAVCTTIRCTSALLSCFLFFLFFENRIKPL
jgi:hypothetical protein